MHNDDDYIKEDTGVKFHDLLVSYKSILADVEAAMTWMHMVHVFLDFQKITEWPYLFFSLL